MRLRCTLHVAGTPKSWEAVLIDGVVVGSDPAGVIAGADELGIEIANELLSTVFEASGNQEQVADAGCETARCSQRAAVVCDALRET